MKPKVYLETTVVSYLTAWPSRDLVRAAHQQITREWWQLRRHHFDLYASQLVLQEVGAGDPSAAAKRLTALDQVPIVELTEIAVALAEELVRRVPLPPRAAVDALHIAIAVASGMELDSLQEAQVEWGVHVPCPSVDLF